MCNKSARHIRHYHARFPRVPYPTIVFDDRHRLRHTRRVLRDFECLERPVRVDSAMALEPRSQAPFPAMKISRALDWINIRRNLRRRNNDRVNTAREEKERGEKDKQLREEPHRRDDDSRRVDRVVAGIICSSLSLINSNRDPKGLIKGFNGERNS